MKENRKENCWDKSSHIIQNIFCKDLRAQNEKAKQMPINEMFNGFTFNTNN